VIINFSGISTIDVSDSLKEIDVPFFAQIDEHIYGVPLDTKLDGIVFFPTIVDPAMGVFPDKITYKRSEPAIFIKTNMPHADWISGTKIDRVNLLATALKIAIGTIKKAKLSASDQDKIKEVIELSRLALIKIVSKQAPD
jgi:hypothetical protein